MPDPVVVYAATRKQVERVVRILMAGRVGAVGYHAGLETVRRARAQDAFMSGSSRVIVATNAFGMGIDKPDVRLVVHYLHSGSLEDYYQEAGRAAIELPPPVSSGGSRRSRPDAGRGETAGGPPA
jgi:ATP-dependent DNA helicase RecQ